MHGKYALRGKSRFAIWEYYDKQDRSQQPRINPGWAKIRNEGKLYNKHVYMVVTNDVRDINKIA